jgi:hypothetical protein
VPSKYAYAFEPNSITYTNVTTDIAETQNYVGTLLTYTITGYIKNSCEVPIEGILVDANNGGNSDTTDANGYYEVWVDSAWSGTVTPSKAHYTFDPNSMSYANVLGDIADQNYVANNIYDFDCDGSIGFGDLAIMCENWLWIGDLKPNCVGHWKMDDNAANTTVVDDSGTGHNGTASRNTNLLAVAGKINGAFLFNGTSDYVNVGNVVSPGAYTKIAWVKRDVGSYYNNIISSGDVLSHALYAPSAYSFKLSAGHVNPFNQVQDPTPLDVNVWYFVAVTFDSSVEAGKMVLYKNGVQVAQASGVPTPSPSTTTYIGRFSTGYYMKGAIDNAMIFNRALTGEEISLLYNNGNGVETFPASEIDVDFNNDGIVNFLDFAEFGLAW